MPALGSALNSAATGPDESQFRRWVLVAGTGLEHGLPESDLLAARAIGTELARQRYGLVSGGWHGVDYVVTDSFLHELHASGLDPQNYLIQVIPDDSQPLLEEGRIVKTPRGPREWLEPQKYADAVILIGGRGGSYKTWLGALHSGLPRFPIGGTFGDSAQAYQQTIDLWEVIPVPGLSHAEFSQLGRQIQSATDASTVAQTLVGGLLWRSLSAVDALARRSSGPTASLFISYSRKDEQWVTRLRTLFRPAERRGVFSTWTDADLKAGLEWETQITERMKTSQAALLLMSENLLRSTYVREVEIPALLRRLGESDFRLFWVLLEDCAWHAIAKLEPIQAVGGVASPINQSTSEGDQQCRLINIVDSITREFRQPSVLGSGPNS